MNYKLELQKMFIYQDKINKAKKYKQKTMHKIYNKIGESTFCLENNYNQMICCDKFENENKMCYTCRIINFYRLYIRKYSALKRSILMRLRNEVKE
jgi:hypothetical protein